VPRYKIEQGEEKKETEEGGTGPEYMAGEKGVGLMAGEGAGEGAERGLARLSRHPPRYHVPCIQRGTPADHS
jgi:hypothetical protein